MSNQLGHFVKFCGLLRKLELLKNWGQKFKKNSDDVFYEWPLWKSFSKIEVDKETLVPRIED